MTSSHALSEVLRTLATRRLTLAVAEGDTGGLLIERLTSVGGSSAVVLGGVVAYHDSLKQSVLGVSAELLRERGAVSAEVAEAMALGVRRIAGADVGVATTGIAGPSGGTPTKPVGLACIAAVAEGESLVRTYHWAGDRERNRAASAEAAFALVLELLRK
jgi:PncC family amidohydrolase